jgi:hypothetical protein
MRKFAIVGAVACVVPDSPSIAHAQAAINGVVRDSSGAVLPGVTVEAASPALIEKVRTVVTDGTGQFKIVDLRAGVYTVTFTLPGFNTIKRDGIELSGNFAATVNADMKVGAIEETITVTGERRSSTSRARGRSRSSTRTCSIRFRRAGRTIKS